MKRIAMCDDNFILFCYNIFYHIMFFMQYNSISTRLSLLLQKDIFVYNEQNM